jgi:agmatine deiminase
VAAVTYFKFITSAMVTYRQLFMPAEWTRHAMTLMAWPGSKSQTFGSLARAANEVAAIAQSISRFEPVKLLVGKEQYLEAQQRIRNAGPYGIEIKLTGMNDLDPWMRDIAPTYVFGNHPNINSPKNDMILQGVDFQFNGWGAKYPTATNTSLARRILEDGQVCRIQSSIVTEGGALEIDGEGTLLATESSLVNTNRNPSVDRDAIERELRQMLGVSKVIWLPGISGADVTDCHVDALARFAKPGLVILSCPCPQKPDIWAAVYQETKQILLDAQDARGRDIEVVEIAEPDASAIGYLSGEMVASYVNYYLANDAVIAPRFGWPKADDFAADTLRKLFPERELVQVLINELPLAGGGIHCVTQQVPQIEL